MDSAPYFWQTNGTDEGGVQGNIADGEYMQQANTSQQQEVTPDARLPTTSDVTVTIQTQIPQGERGVSKQHHPNSTSESTMPIGLAPDAIEPKARTYTCRICQMTFPNKSLVTVHSRLHTDHQGKPYRCSFCGKGFSTNFYLKQHERIHSGQKPYKCPMCEQSFKQLSHVQQHVRTHTGVRPYKCHWPGCGKAFLQQSHLKSHEARHTPKTSTGEKPYKCHWPDCGKSFPQLTNLKSHLARHNPGKGKNKKGANNQKKTEVKQNEAQSTTISFQDVINQAAAAAEIVPDPGPEVVEEAEIRPYLCPGCSKVYVREATFKKHLEECKTKLQLSITATASALGMEPQAADSMIEYPGMISQRTQEQVQITEKKDKNLVTFTTQTVTQGHSTAPSDNSEVKPNVVHVKEEPLLSRPSSSSNIEQGQVFTTSSYKLEQVTNSIPVLAGTTEQNPVMHFDSRSTHVMSVTEGNNASGSQLQQNDNYLLSSAPTVVSDGNMTSVAGDPLVETVASGPEHSTINQAAIRWQWDQPVPRLNFP